MNFEDRFQAEWVSAGDAVLKINRTRHLDVLEHELADIKDSLNVIEEKQRRLANLSRLYN